MASIRRTVAVALNGVLRGFHCSVLPDWEAKWWCWNGRFVLNGYSHELFCHSYNCGWPPARMTERSVELSVADRWLSNHRVDDLHEIGAVTPYYWPHRVSNVVDPHDSHSLVNHKKSLFDMSFVDKPVISISTIEHVGRPDYEQAEQPILAIRALEKILAESPCFLVTMPLGYNNVVDKYIGQTYRYWSDVRTSFLARGSADNLWCQTDDSIIARAKFGSRDYRRAGSCANAMVILER
jgi:hypothetical protein